MLTRTKISGVLKEERNNIRLLSERMSCQASSRRHVVIISKVFALLIALGRSTWLTAFVKRSAHFVQFGSPCTFTHPKRRP